MNITVANGYVRTECARLFKGPSAPLGLARPFSLHELYFRLDRESHFLAEAIGTGVHQYRIAARIVGWIQGYHELRDVPRRRVQAWIRAELSRAYRKFPDQRASAMEGWGVMQEEIDELWEATKDQGLVGTDRDRRIKEESVQVAAMGMRFLLDCC